MGTCPRTARTARAAFSLPLHDAQQRPERAMPGRPLGACGTHPRGHQLRIGWYQWQQGVQHRLACMQPLRGVSLAMFSHTRPNRREPSLLLSGGPLKFSRPMRLRHRISEFDVLNFCCMRRLAQRFSEKGGGGLASFSGPSACCFITCCWTAGYKTGSPQPGIETGAARWAAWA